MLYWQTNSTRKGADKATRGNLLYNREDMMDRQQNVNGLNTLTGVALSNAGAGVLLVAEPLTEDQHDELDDDVEALIIQMDGTAVEHLFLQAQRQV
jgi:hypothetical protein